MYAPSSQAGLATFRPAPVRQRMCPKCTTHPLVYGRHRDDEPWAYCTNPDCDFDLESW